VTILPALLLAAAATASPVLLVLPDGEAPQEGWRGPVFHDLQEAVDAAPNGATVRVAAGHHHLEPVLYDGDGTYCRRFAIDPLLARTDFVSEECAAR